MNEPQTELLEAEDIRQAIIGGEVDAFVVGNDDNRKVLLLTIAYQRYRQVVERMQQGAVTATGEGSILYANQPFCDMLGVPLAQCYTVPLENYAVIADRPRLRRLLLLPSRDSHIDISFNRRDAELIPARLSLASFSEGYVTLLVTDLRPLQWPRLTLDALDSMRDSLQQLNKLRAANPEARQALDNIGAEINGLARMIDEMLDVGSTGNVNPKE